MESLGEQIKKFQKVFCFLYLLHCGETTSLKKDAT